MELQEAKDAIKKRKVVTYDGINYTINAISLRYIVVPGRWEYCLELKDLKANSVVIANMGKVEVKLE